VDFLFEHRFDAPLKEVAEAILDEGFQESLDGMEPLKKREVLEQTEKGGKVVRRSRCVLGTDLGGAKKFLGNAEPAWVEEAVWNEATQKWTWVIKPEVAADILSSEGVTELIDEGEETLRRVTGFVKIRIPLYGGRVENVIVKGLQEAYENEADRLRKWLDR
jgi:Protein of unknown function (DUF2505)